jgi:mono/diheme cytochrome c family protein
MSRNGVAAILLMASLAACLIAAALTASAAPSQGRDTDDRGVWRSIAQAPIEARAKRNPYADQPDAILAGEKLFHRHCAECHGKNGEGLRGASDLRSPGVQNATDGELVRFLGSGKLARGMPSWSGLPAERRWQIVTYLKSLGADAK